MRSGADDARCWCISNAGAEDPLLGPDAAARAVRWSRRSAALDDCVRREYSVSGTNHAGYATSRPLLSPNSLHSHKLANCSGRAPRPGHALRGISRQCL